MPDFRIPEEVVGRTIATMVRERALAAPNRVAIVGVSPRTGETLLTYAQLVWRARKLADAYRQQGLGQGDRIGVMLGNDAAAEFAVSMLAVHELGGVFVPVNARFAIEEIVYVINKAGCKALVTLKTAAAAIEKARPRMPGLLLLATVSATPDDSPGDWYRLLASGTVQPDRVPPTQPDDVAEILFTSGTTAHPKGAVMTHQSALCSSYSSARGLDMQANDVWQSFMPCFTTGGVRNAVMGAWFAGTTIVLDPELKLPEMVARMERNRTTKYVGTPAFYIFLLDLQSQQGVDLSNMKAFVFGGAPTSAEVIKRLHDGFPGIQLRNSYAPTETGPGGTSLIAPELFAKPTSIGKPWPLVEVRIVDDDDRPVPTGQRGEICTRGPCIMREYYGDPERSAEALKGGWMHTGDIGELDADGCLYIVDRKKDMVIRGGHNIASLEVEAVLAQHPSVSEAAVVGVPHPKLGEDLHAFVLLRAGQTATPEEIREFCKDKLADYKTPRRITIAEQLPRGPLGKVLKSALRETAVGLKD